MRRVTFCLALAAIAAAVMTPTQMSAQGPPATLPPQAHANVTLPDHFDKTPGPIRDLPEPAVPQKPRGGRDFEPGHPDAIGHTNPPWIDPLADRGVISPAAGGIPQLYTDGLPVDPSARVAPPDTTGDIGPNHYVQWVNLRYVVYNLTRASDGSISGFAAANGFPKQGNAIWAGFGGPCETSNDGDPIVQYDQLSDRWILTQFAVSATPFTQCVAVSQTGDPTGNYNRYSYSYATSFNDYPKMGVWSDGYYITYNMFKNGRTFAGSRVCAFEKSQMLVGQAARQICASTSTKYGSLLPADLEGTTLPPAGSPNYLLSISSSSLLFWKFAVNWTAGTGTLTGPITVSGAAAFSRACSGGTCIPQPGTTQLLDSLADRLMYRLSYRNLPDHEALLVNHSVASSNVSAIRWYELSNATGATLATANPVVRQQGTFQPDTNFRWMGSAAMDKTGGIAIGYNASNASTLKPSIFYAYRGPADPQGALGGETQVLLGPGVQTGNRLSRWGDYSTLSIDPTDGCTMVFTGEYIPSNGSFNWATAIQTLKLSTCK